MKKIYSVTIAWNDSDSDEGDFGTYVRAANYEEAERLAREEMRNCHLENYPPDEDETEEEACAYYTGHDGKFGGAVIEIVEGAIWLAADLEASLRAVIGYAHSRAEDLHAEMEASLDGPNKLIAEAAWWKADDAVTAGRNLIAQIDAIAPEVPLESAA